MPDTVDVRAVETPRDLQTFILLPWQLYRDDPLWVPQLRMDQRNLLNPRKNPFFDHARARHFLAWRDGKAVGRISAIINDLYNQFQGEKTGFFGFFESPDDPRVSRALFAEAERWLHEQKMDRMRGPTNPDTNNTIGLLVDAFDKSPVVYMPYNPAFYPGLVEDAGLRKAKDLYAYYMDENATRISDKIRRVSEMVRKRHNITIRSARLNRIEEEIELIKLIYNDAWTRNWGFVPWTDAELEHLGKELKPVAVADLVMLAFVGDEPAGFSLSLPDFNQALLHNRGGRMFPFGLLKILWYARRINLLRVLAMGVRHRYRHMGIDAIFYYETYSRGTSRGYHHGEFSWILEDNEPMRLVLEKWGARIYKTYRMFDKEF